MCGITGYVGRKDPVQTAVHSLRRLEYRGYDSAGVAFASDSRVHIVRAGGRIVNLENKLQATSAVRTHRHAPAVAIAHTRWATHGAPGETNSHPHTDCSGRIALVHNGIFENWEQLRTDLIGRGHRFASATDTEVLAHLIEEQLPDAPLEPADLLKACSKALSMIRGAYAVAVICSELQDTMVAARHDSPLVIGLAEHETFVASDIAAIIQHTRDVVVLENGDMACITPGSIRIIDRTGATMQREPIHVDWDDSAAERDGFAHFMLKEIHEGPATIRATLAGRLTDEGHVELAGAPFDHNRCEAFDRIVLVGCGTAYHAAMAGRRLFEQLLRIPISAEVASEFRYSDPLLNDKSLVILVSQSGETADTLAALREARLRNAATVAIVNVAGSTLSRESDWALLTQAGPEIGVASTKAYLAQLTALALLGIWLQQNRGTPQGAIPANDISAGLASLAPKVSQCLEGARDIEALAERIALCRRFFYLGRGYDHAAALEAALKLKEISYLHAEAYAAGEMKHGPLALIEPGSTIIGLCTQRDTQDKMLSNLEEVRARHGFVIGVVLEESREASCFDERIVLPSSGLPDALMPALVMPAMQLLAYHVARILGCEIDQPRNLAKSVTVE